MIFQAPTISANITKRAFRNYVVAYNSSPGRKLSDKIRGHHLYFFDKFIEVYAVDLRKKLNLSELFHNIKPEDIPEFTTNNVYLRNLFTGINDQEEYTDRTENNTATAKRTIYNYICRLEKAGVLTKKIHGLGINGKLRTSEKVREAKNFSRFSYSIKINPQILAIFDFRNPENFKNPKFSKLSEPEFYEALRKSFPEFRLLTGTTLNKINRSETSLSGVSNASANQSFQNAIAQIKAGSYVNPTSLHEPTETQAPVTNPAEGIQNSFYAGAKQCTGTNGNTSTRDCNEETEFLKAERIFAFQNDPEQLLSTFYALSANPRRRLFKSVMPEVARKAHKLSYSIMFYENLLKLFQGKEIPKPVKFQTIAYIYRIYFGKVQYLAEMKNHYEQYIWRIHAVKSWVNRENFSMKNIWPMAYLDVDRRGKNPETGKRYISFVNTRAWYEDGLKFNRIKLLRKVDSELMKRMYRIANDTNRKISNNMLIAPQIIADAERLVTNLTKDPARTQTLLAEFNLQVKGLFAA